MEFVSSLDQSNPSPPIQYSFFIINQLYYGHALPFFHVHVRDYIHIVHMFTFAVSVSCMHKNLSILACTATCTRIWTNMCWGISAGSDCVHTIWEWSLANGMVDLALVINVSVEKFKMRSMCFSFASVLKYASCAWDTETSLKECLWLCVCLLLRALNLFLS